MNNSKDNKPKGPLATFLAELKADNEPLIKSKDNRLKLIASIEKFMAEIQAETDEKRNEMH